MKKLISIILVILICFLTGCSTSSQNSSKYNSSTKQTEKISENDALKQGDVIEFNYTQDGVDEFYTDLQKALSKSSLKHYAVVLVENIKFDEINIYNITPENGKETTGYSLFYDFENGWLFLYDGNEVLDWDVGLDHIHKPAFADVNNDGYYEYITCVFYNGDDTNLQRLTVFDLKTKSEYVIATSLTSTHVICATSSQGRCYVYYDSALLHEPIENKFTIDTLSGEVKYSKDKDDDFNKGFYFEDIPSEEE